jgi:hypothetical protein
MYTITSWTSTLFAHEDNHKTNTIPRIILKSVELIHRNWLLFAFRGRNLKVNNFKWLDSQNIGADLPPSKLVLYDKSRTGF